MSTQTVTRQEQDQTTESKIQKLRELFADAPEVGKKALENALHELKSQASDLPPAVESAGRIGSRLGKVSELTSSSRSHLVARSVCGRSCGCCGATSRKVRTRSAPS